MNYKFWSLALAAFCLSLAPINQARAEGILMLSGGSTTGTYDYNDSTNTFEGWNDELDHDTAGTASAVGIYFAADWGLLLGAGYQSYSFKGSSSWERDNYTVDGFTFDNTTVEFTETEYSLSGPFAALGLNMKLGDVVRLMPQVRVGTAKASMKETVTMTFTLGGTQISESFLSDREDQTLTMRVFSLPILFKLNDSLLLGLEAQQLQAETAFEIDTETVTGTAKTAYMLSLNALF